jgi:hypothetical protein
MDLGGGNLLPRSNAINSFHNDTEVVLESMLQARRSVFINCMGVEVTLSEQLWLTFASVLATFNIERARDDAGNEIPISDEFKEYGFVR